MIENSEKFKKSKKLDQLISDSLEATPDLLPYMPYLLQDLWALGSSVDQIIEAVGRLPFRTEENAGEDAGKTITALDLGCGKGAVSVRLASEFGFSVVGIDAMDEFLSVAGSKAAEFGVEDRCSFINGDIHEYTGETHTFDIVVLASLGFFFGSIGETVGTLRRQVRSGGYIIIDDGYLRREEKLERKGYEQYRTYSRTVKELTSRGDSIVEELDTSDFSSRLNREYIKVISKRGEELAADHPEFAPSVRDYITGQNEECDILDNELAGALWVIRKQER
jgi:ubiquinone/menaquinone biosynthesis C-methylase UbiE